MLSNISTSFRNSSGFISPPKLNNIYTILVVDDSKLNRRMLIKSLKDGCHLCDEAEDGEEAVNMVSKKLSEGGTIFDAILMDFMMPKMDGPTATKKIRDMGYAGIIIGVTGNALPSDVIHFTTSGADRVLLKPVDMDALQGALLSLLTQYTEKL
jgi:CheY-like chemotaxis protein